MEKVVMEEYQHMFNCATEDLPKKAKKADRNGTIDGLVVSAVPTLIGTSNPNKNDLEDSGIYFLLSDFLKTPDPASLGSKFEGLHEVGVYKAVYDEHDELNEDEMSEF